MVIVTVYVVLSKLTEKIVVNILSLSLSLSLSVSFEEHPEDVVVDVGQDNVEFHCTPPTNYTPALGYFFGWTFYSATGGQENFLRSMPDR